MKLSECLELSVAQKDKIEEILTKFVSENSPESIARALTRIIDSVVWSRSFELRYTKDPYLLNNVLSGIDSYSEVLSCISLYLLNDWSKENSYNVLPDNDQSAILELIQRRADQLLELKKEKKNGSNI